MVAGSGVVNSSNRNAAQALCDLVQSRCGVIITVPDMEAMFMAEWSKLSTLAHAIHAEQQRKISYASQASGMKGLL